MSDILEKAARALHYEWAMVMGHVPRDWPSSLPEERERFTKMTIAVLKAIREPSEEMMGPIPPGYDGMHDQARIAIWQVCIDSILGDNA